MQLVQDVHPAAVCSELNTVIAKLRSAIQYPCALQLPATGPGKQRRIPKGQYARYRRVCDLGLHPLPIPVMSVKKNLP
jgi:hypothetical protein